MRCKLGLIHESTSDGELISELLSVMNLSGADFTETFLRLATVPMPAYKALDAESLLDDSGFLEHLRLPDPAGRIGTTSIRALVALGYVQRQA